MSKFIPFKLLFILGIYGGTLCSEAQAGVIFQAKSFDLFTGPLVQGVSLDPLIFDRFDRGTGVLTSVDVRLSGSIQLKATLPGSQTALIQPVNFPPYPYSVKILQSYIGLNFVRQPRLLLAGIAPGVQIPMFAYYHYEHTFTLDMLTDVSGAAHITTTKSSGGFPTTGISVSPEFTLARRDDFTSSTSSSQLSIIPKLNVLIPVFAGKGSFVGTVTSRGNISLIYNFTEIPKRNIDVSEPPALILFGLGFLGLGVTRFRRKMKSRKTGNIITETPM